MDEQTILIEMGVGHDLNKARRVKEMSIKQCADVLKIRHEILTALEKDLYAELPEATYTYGFARAYAVFLGLDGAEIVKRMQATGMVERKVEHTRLNPIETNVLPSKQLVLIVLAVVIFLVLGWWLYIRLDRLDMAPQMPDAPMSEQDSVPSDGDEVEGAPATDVDPNLMTPDEFTTAPVDELVTESAQTTAFEEKLAEETEKLAEAVLHSENDAPRVLMVAEDDVWLRVYGEQTGEDYVNMVLKKGEKYWVPIQPDAVADIGRPEALSLVVDGRDYGSPGVSGRVLKGLDMSPEFLKEKWYGEDYVHKPYWRRSVRQNL